MDSYQPIFDAVRSKINNGNVGEAIENAMRDANLGHFFQQAAVSAQYMIAEYERPSAIFRPKLSVDGELWCALYGDNLQNGVAGFGDTPAKAMSDFDKNWHKPIKAIDAELSALTLKDKG